MLSNRQFHAFNIPLSIRLELMQNFNGKQHKREPWIKKKYNTETPEDMLILFFFSISLPKNHSTNFDEATTKNE